MLVVTNEFGVRINVMIVPFGAKLGGDRFGTNKGDALVEFYDPRSTKSFPPFGQFICRMSLERILDARESIQLSSFITEWRLSQSNVAQIANHVRGDHDTYS